MPDDRALTTIGALRISDPEEWRRRVEDARKRHRTAAEAAEELAVSWRTFMRWLAMIEDGTYVQPEHTTGKRPNKRSPNAPHNPRRISPAGALSRTHPDVWEKQVRDAMRKNDGRVVDAAADLDVSAKTLGRWLKLSVFANVERGPTGRRPR